MGTIQQGGGWDQYHIMQPPWKKSKACSMPCSGCPITKMMSPFAWAQQAHKMVDAWANQAQSTEQQLQEMTQRAERAEARVAELEALLGSNDAATLLQQKDTLIEQLQSRWTSFMSKLASCPRADTAPTGKRPREESHEQNLPPKPVEQTSKSSKTGKRRSKQASCAYCREKHISCIYDEGSTTCQACLRRQKIDPTHRCLPLERKKPGPCQGWMKKQLQEAKEAGKMEGAQAVLQKTSERTDSMLQLNTTRGVDAHAEHSAHSSGRAMSEASSPTASEDSDGAKGEAEGRNCHMSAAERRDNVTGGIMGQYDPNGAAVKALADLSRVGPFG